MGERPNPSAAAADWPGDLWDGHPPPPRELTDCRQLDDFQPLQNKTLTVRPSVWCPDDLNPVWIWIFIFRFQANVGPADTVHQLASCSVIITARGWWNMVGVSDTKWIIKMLTDSTRMTGIVFCVFVFNIQQIPMRYTRYLSVETSLPRTITLSTEYRLFIFKLTWLN